MDNRSSKIITVLILLIPCQLFGTSFSASVFGLNFGALKNTAQSHIEQVPQFLNRVFKHPSQHSLSNNPSAYHNREVNNNNNGRISFPFGDQQDSSLNNFNKTPNKGLQGYSFAPHVSDSSNNVTPGTNLIYPDNLAPVRKDSRGSYYESAENSQSLPPHQYNVKETSENEIVSAYTSVTPDTDVSTEYTTGTSDYDWTTPDEPLNRIGAPPAVVASLLG